MPKLDLSLTRRIRVETGEVLSLRGPGFRWDRQPQPVNYDFTDLDQLDPIFSPGNEQRSLVVDADAVNGAYVRFDNNGYNSRKVYRLVPAEPPAADQEILVRFKVHHVNFTSGGSNTLTPLLRSNYDAATGNFTGYRVEAGLIGGDGTNLRVEIRKWTGSGQDSTQIGGALLKSGLYGNWCWMRARVQGSGLSLKVWPVSQSEPSGWDRTATDTDWTSGYLDLATVLSNGAHVAHIDWLSYGAGGVAPVFP